MALLESAGPFTGALQMGAQVPGGVFSYSAAVDVHVGRPLNHEALNHRRTCVQNF